MYRSSKHYKMCPLTWCDHTSATKIGHDVEYTNLPLLHDKLEHGHLNGTDTSDDNTWLNSLLYHQCNRVWYHPRRCCRYRWV